VYDFAIDQPLHMYAPLTLELMFDYLENGGEALPQVGDTVTPGEDLSIENKRKSRGSTRGKNSSGVPQR